jgi:hypothetical protein
MKSFKQTLSGKSRSRGKTDPDTVDRGANQGGSEPRDSNVSDSEGTDSANSLSDNRSARWGSKWWNRKNKSVKEPSVSQSSTSHDPTRLSHGVSEDPATSQTPEEADMSNSKGLSSEKGREKGILITENAIEVVGLVKIAADMTSVSGPLKAICGVTERILTLLKVRTYILKSHEAVYTNTVYFSRWHFKIVQDGTIWSIG